MLIERERPHVVRKRAYAARTPVIAPPLDASCVACCGIVVDVAVGVASRSGRRLRLSPTDLELLKLLMANRGQVFSRALLIQLLWADDANIDPRTVDVHVGRLRRALTVGCAPDPIRTVRNGGYKLGEACEKEYAKWARRRAKLRLDQHAE